MTPNITQALQARLTAMADDELILAQRDAEWTGHAPILEEDIALANLAQDELGHATTMFGLVEALNGRTPDQMAFFRSAPDFLCAQLLELPKGDWAFTMLRQYLFDAYEHVLYDALSSSSYQPLADVIAKFRGEEMYHLRHSHIWVERLGLGTAESNGRMQQALDKLWPYTVQLFTPMTDDHLLVAENIFPDLAELHEKWLAIVTPHLANCDLQIPDGARITVDRSTHTPHLPVLLEEMQVVARWEPEGEW